MKKQFFAIVLSLVCIYTHAQSINGAWKKLNTSGTTETTCIIADDYFMESDYDITNKKFIGTLGGVCKAGKDAIDITIEFNTMDNSEVGSNFTLGYKLEGDKMIIEIQGQKSEYQRIDDGKGALFGNWRITEREQDSKISPMRAGARKTLKILSGSRFQWAAINTETKEFFGTGGGTYTFTNGAYTEKIEFFSRDSSRIGAYLNFQGKVEGKRWHHSGKSSKGEPISEIWTRQN